MTVGLFLALKKTAKLFDQDTMPFNADHFHESDPVAVAYVFGIDINTYPKVDICSNFGMFY